MQRRVVGQDALMEVIRQEQHSFAAKMRMVRAILGWSQSDMARETGLTQRAVHKLEQGETGPRRATFLAITDVWRRRDIVIEDMPDGSFRVTVPPSVVQPAKTGRHRDNPDRLRIVAGTLGYRT